MVIEMFIDTQDLTNNQSLIIIDDQGRRRDVEEALNKSTSSSGGARGQSARPEVILERWIVKLGDSPRELPQDLTKILPRTYKDTVVLFRALYSCSRLIPAWRFGKRVSKDRPSVRSPKLRYRILDGPHADRAQKNDHLSIPLFETHDDVLEKFVFDPIDSPAGAFSINVTYRLHCDFRIDDSEAFLSSRFMGMDEDYFEPSLGRRQDAVRRARDVPSCGTTEVGSLPSNRRRDNARPEQGQAYGSMSTFHQMGPPASTSPLSALRAARAAGSESPEDMMPKKAPPNTRSAQGSRSSLRSADGAPGIGRRPSVSFMPFKSPSLSASPSQTEQLMASARGSYGKSSPLAALAEARAPASLSPYGSVPSRSSPNPADQAIPSSFSSSPKPPPPQRFSSSFGHRKSKLSTGGSSRTEDDNSSGKASITSSNAQPGSGVLAEVGGASSGSIHTDDDNISDFIKMLDRKKDLKSFNTVDDLAAAEASTRRTSAALSKFQRMKDSNDALSNSMYSSLHLHRSSSSSSRQLSSVPPMVAGTSISTSSSPGKPISPHTPHTPTIPSRLSANSTIDYSHRSLGREADHHAQSGNADAHHDSVTDRIPTPGAIDIPTSPRPFHPSYRRSSSAAHQARTAQVDDEDIFPFAMRSASLGVDDDRPPLSLSALAGLQSEVHDGSVVAVPSVENRDLVFGPLFNPSSGDNIIMDRKTSFERGEEGGSIPTRGIYRPRIGRGSGRGSTPPQGSSSSLLERGSGSGASSDNRGGRLSFTRPPSNYEDDEPLLFAMSDLSAVQQSRRSLEEARGGGDSGASSRRASRRGGF
jgi:autophagy-related protein 13